MLPDLPLYALQRIADRWLVWAPDADPRLPAVCTVAVIDAGLSGQWLAKKCAGTGHCDGKAGVRRIRRSSAAQKSS
jgi:hypothetical protein